ncbi:MAG: response regulator, partial [Bacteroidota bacterium]
VGKGTTFSVVLPIQATANSKEEKSLQHKQEKAEAILPVSPAPIPTTAPAAAPLKMEEDEKKPLLLLVDDNPDVMTYLSGLLVEDYRLLQATDGEAGVATALQHIPDLIISDIMMPRKNGYELSQQLKGDARTSHIPIILLTAKVTQEDKLAGLESGADVFLTKPFDRSELLIRLENLLDNRHKLRHYYAQGELPLVTDALHPDREAVFLHELEAAVEERLDDPDFGVPLLAAAVTMSQSQVYRKLKALVGKTPSQFIRSVRLRRGRELLTDPARNVSEIAYEVGFADPNYFTRTFNEEFGSSPSDWRRKRGITSP